MRYAPKPYRLTASPRIQHPAEAQCAELTRTEHTALDFGLTVKSAAFHQNITHLIAPLPRRTHPPGAGARASGQLMRWTAKRKAAILAQFDLLAAHGISADELAEWRRAFQIDGTKGLRVTRLQHYQSQRKRRAPRMTKTLTAALLAAVFSTAASAAPITGELSLNGSDTFTASASAFTINFINPANIGGQTGSFVSMPNCTGCVTMITTLTNASSNFELYSASEGGITSTLIAANISGFTFTPPAGGGLESLAVTGSGTLTLTGADPTPGFFDLTTQGPGGTAEVTFSSTQVATAVREPGSLLVLAAALGALLWSRRRFQW